MRFVKKLSGHSGCDVNLMSDQDLFVRKVSASIDYNSRLEEQMRKQINFSSSFIKTPVVWRSGYTSDGLFYFDMQYIKGVSFFEYIQKNSIASVKAKLKIILDYISESNEISEGISLDITSKINSLQIDRKYDRYKEYCLNFDWQQVNKSYCHGDLTFENIIIWNEEVYFIDFLDSFTDTKLIDYSKIFQELYAFWSYRNKAKKFNIKYVILDEMVNLVAVTREATLRLLVLSLLRILPYSDKDECQFLEEQMKYILENNGE